MPFVTGDGGLATTGDKTPGALPIVPAGSTVPRVVAPYAETSASWPPVWTPRPELQVLAADMFVGPRPATALLARRYGPQIREPGESKSTDRGPLRLAGHWVQIKLPKLPGQSAPQLLWAGRISEQRETPHGVGNALTGTPGGETQYVAYGPWRLLERQNFNTSWWYQNTTPVELGSTYGFNEPRTGGSPENATQTLPRGNRSADLFDIARGGEPTRRSFLFGGDLLWSARDALEYVLERFVNPSVAGGPALFELAGTLEPLKKIKDFVPVRVCENVADLLNRLVPERYGLTFRFVARTTDAKKNDFIGWELRVLSIAPQAVTLGGVTIPAEMVTNLPILTSRDYDVQVERSTAQRYRTIRVVGERVVSCFSAGPGSADVSPLQRGWTIDAENDYKSSDDQERQCDKFRDVFQTFILRAGWDFIAGQADPVIPPQSASGPTRPVFSGGAAAAPKVQRKHVKTLPHLPLRVGFDYSTDPPRIAPGGSTASDPYEVEYLPLMVFARVSVTLPGQSAPTVLPVLVDRIGAVAEDNRANASVAPLDYEWGFRLRSTPNHAYAQGIALGAASALVPDATNSVDWNQLDCTLALELDQRITAEQQLEVSSPATVENDGGILIVEVPDAHFWWLAPNTILSAEGTTYVKSPAAGTVLRDDRWKLALALAGAVGKYQRERFAATVRVRDVAPWHEILGFILAPTYQAGGVLIERAQITSVAWDFQALTTTLELG